MQIITQSPVQVHSARHEVVASPDLASPHFSAVLHGSVLRAWDAGWRAACDDGGPIPPRYVGPWGDQLKAAWLDGWADAQEVVAGREEARRAAYEEEQEVERMLRKRDGYLV